jgi:hypothetical protein
MAQTDSVLNKNFIKVSKKNSVFRYMCKDFMASGKHIEIYKSLNGRLTTLFE